jgi:hypothetical protein
VLDASVLARLLDAPDLAHRLQALPAPALREVLLEIGVEDAGELIALTTFEQLRDVFDEDLWRAPGPGADAGFDAERFALWLEVLQEAGDAFVADRLAEFSEDFLAFAFSRLVRVIDVSRAAAAMSDPDEADLLDKPRLPAPTPRGPSSRSRRPPPSQGRRGRSAWRGRPSRGTA